MNAGVVSRPMILQIRKHALLMGKGAENVAKSIISHQDAGTIKVPIPQRV